MTTPYEQPLASSRFNGIFEKYQHLIKYLAIGASASAIDVILFFVLYNYVGTSEWVAHSISVPVSVVFSFIVNARHNFKTEDHMWLRLASFVLICTIGFIVGLGVIYGTKSVLMTAGFAEAFSANSGKIASLPVVFVIQYLLNSRITYREIER